MNKIIISMSTLEKRALYESARLDNRAPSAQALWFIQEALILRGLIVNRRVIANARETENREAYEKEMNDE